MEPLRRAVRWIPARLRQYGRGLIEKAVTGLPRELWECRGSELEPSLDLVLAHYHLHHPDVCFLQVGAFDGVSGDPIYPMIEKYGLRGVLVEPQRDAFERLRENYSGFDPAKFVLLNAAIGAHDGTAVMYRIRPEAGVPAWLSQVSSFDRGVVMGYASAVPGIEPVVEAEEVRCITFATLMRETGIEHFDLLQVDAEGYDAEILRLFDVPRRKPAIVRFEHVHLSRADHVRTVRALVEAGYRFAISGVDTLAYSSEGSPEPAAHELPIASVLPDAG